MKLKMLSVVVSCAIAGGTIPLCSAADTVIPSKQEFLDIRGQVNVKQEAASSYFVRVDMAPVVQWQKNQESQGKSVTAKQRQAYIAQVKKALQKVIVQTTSAGFKAIDPVVVTDVGFSVIATREQADTLAKDSGVKLVVPKRLQEAQRSYSTRWVGGERAHTDLGFKGKGQTIAIIDSGVDYFHSDFLGSGEKDDFVRNDPAVVETGSFPTSVVVGGHDFAGFDYDPGSSEPANRVPQPDADPIDDGNHGTHVAGIAAGRSLGPSEATGIAPEADLYALKVFGNDGSTNLTSQAIERAMDPNGDGDPEDAVDVINMSLGSPFGSPDAATSVSAQNAIEAGAVVVAAAGNGDDIAFISGAPAAAKDVIAVASSLAGGVESFYLSFDSETGNDYDFFAKYAAISPALETRVEAALTISEPFEACTALTNNFDGAVAVISRGSCAFTTKLNNALAAGASAAVVINNEPGSAFAMGGTDVTLPGAMISQAEGALLLAELNAGSITAEFAATNVREDTSDDDTISDFSSRGPGPTGFFKPDITAPGDEIESALAGGGRETLTISGTSMAAPQVAGMAALLREKFPDLAPNAIKAIIQNSSRPAKLLGQVGSPALSLQGTGVIDIEKALASTAYAMPGGLGFGVFKPEYNDAVTQMVEVTNFSDSDQRFQVRVEANSGAGSKGIKVDVSQEVYVGAGQTAQLPVTLRMQSNELQGAADLGEYDGWIVLESAETSLRVGYMALIEPASRVDVIRQADEIKLRNVAFGDATVLGFTQADVNVRDSNLGSSLGYSSVSEESVAFAFNAPQDWTHFSQYVLTMNIDVNEDGQPDFRAMVGDLNALDSENNQKTTGNVASGIDNLATGTRNLLYVANVETNSSVLRYQLDAYGDFGFLAEGDTTFDYTLTLRNRFNGDGEAAYMGSGSVDLARQVSFDFPGIILPGQGGAQLQVGGQGVPMLVIPTENEPAKRVKLLR